MVITHYSIWIRFWQIGLFLCSFAGILMGREWPDSMEEVIGGFSDSRDFRFERGTRFSGGGNRPVVAWNKSETIWSTNGRVFDLLPKDSSILVIQDSDDFRTFYKGMKIRPKVPTDLQPGTVVGTSGDSSWVMEVFDMRSKRIVNPVTLLPDQQNLPAPEVGDVVFSRIGQRFAVSDGSNIPQGSWNVQFDLVLPSGRRLTPKDSSLYWLGNKLANIRFDGLTEKDHKIVMESTGINTYEDVYSSEGLLSFMDVIFGPGEKNIELRLRDELDRLIIQTINLNFF